jgi:superfamily II DNA helicase RecQ
MTSPPTSLTIDIRPAPARVWTPTGVNIYKKHFDKSNEKLKEHISNASIETYGQIAKVLQVDTVTSLANGRNTFLLAGTGFGKSRIAEMYYQLIPGRYKAVVLVLNPLDTLGDNQVLEKVQAGFTAINLTKLTFNEQTAKEILIGDYQFVYLSPEIFLNSKMFQDLYYSSTFQNRIALIVIDEAHMIYIWGIVESGPAEKQTSSHLRHQDSGLFRPSYGKLGAQLLFRNDKPLLLLSATCRPMATEAIMKSLKLTDESLDILRGELTRPEIRIIRVTMSNSLSSSLDVIKLFPSKLDVSDNNMVPTLVYSGSRNRTMAVLEAIDRARETPDQSKFANSTCARRFHSCTGDKDKEKCIEEFADGKFPLISCTMALGLGQNWKRVRAVAHMGRGDPASIGQMIGRCGRDGKPGLAVLFVEKNRPKGKNQVGHFKRDEPQSDLNRMDALAVTPLCLRVAFAIDNM